MKKYCNKIRKNSFIYIERDAKSDIFNWVTLARKGNRRAFGELVRIYGDMVYGLCLSLSESRTEAQDMTQEVFLKAFKKIRLYKKNKSFNSWLYVITKNLWIDKYVKKKNPKVLSLTQISQNQIPDPGENPEERLMKNEFENMVEQGIQTLPPKYRFPIILRIYENKSYKDIAEICNCSAIKARVAVHRAIIKLREYLNQEYKENEM